MNLLSKMRLPVVLASMFFLGAAWFVACSADSGAYLVEYELFQLSSSSFSFSFIFDKSSLSFGALVAFIATSVFTFACKYMEEDPWFFRFIWILMSFVISMELLIFSGSVFSLLLGWDGLGISSFALIIYYQSGDSLSAGFQTLMANRVGDAIIVCSMVLFALAGTYDYLSITDKSFLLVLVLSVAALTKSAQYPFSSWLPAAMAAPTPVSALVHSSTLVTAGIYLVIRLSMNQPLSGSACSLLLFCGSVTCLLGGWAATFENDVKKVIALSTLSQLGVMTFSLGLGLSNLALFHLYTHALFKALLFLAAGVVLMMTFGAQDIRGMGGVGLSLPSVMVLFNVSSLCLIGAPFLSAFYSKHLILEMMSASVLNSVSVLIMSAATFMTAAYVFRTLKSSVWSKQMTSINAIPTSPLIYGPLLVLGFGAVVGGEMFTLLDQSYTEMAILPSYLGVMINAVTLSGVVAGLIFIKGARKSWPLSTLFFLTPTYSLSNKVVAPVLTVVGVMDYGWTEPASAIKSYLVSSTSWLLTQEMGWPNANNTMLRYAFILVFCVWVMYLMV
uniref:NADH dehydrogenase subunit 5 n=1 Tax=Melampus sincaporensis TaxID=1628046 RepID=UPI0030033E15|nr:NADH dehydrogenase subunit 5 [Melampus sincaporensis]